MPDWILGFQQPLALSKAPEPPSHPCDALAMLWQQHRHTRCWHSPDPCGLAPDNDPATTNPPAASTLELVWTGELPPLTHLFGL